MRQVEAGTPAVDARPRGVRIAGALGLQEAGRALRDFATYLPSQILPAIAGFLVLPVLARKLAPTELGVLAIAQTLITLGWAAAGSWLTTAVIRELPAARQRADLRGFSVTLARGLGLTGVAFAAFSFVLLAIAAFSHAVAQTLPLVIAASAGLILQNLAVTLYAAELRPRAFAVVEVLARVGGIALGVWLVFRGHKVQGYLLGVAAGSLVVGGLGLLTAWPRGETAGPRSTGQDLRAWIQYGAPVAVSSVATWGLFLVDRFLLAGLKNTGAVGLYSVGAVIGDKVVGIPTYAFFTAARPLLMRGMERTGRAEVERLVRAYTRITLLMAAPIVAVAAVTAPAVVQILAGNLYYYRSATVIAWVALGSLIMALALFGNSGLTTARQSRPLVYAALIGLVVNVGANLVLIPAYGIKGAAIATPIGNLAFLAAGQWWSRRYATWRFPWATFARVTVAATAAYFTGHEALRLTGSPIATFSGASATALVAYVAALLLLGERRAFAVPRATA
jgi:O-antigen/teichoic acid export membrane protein